MKLRKSVFKNQKIIKLPPEKIKTYNYNLLKVSDGFWV